MDELPISGAPSSGELSYASSSNATSSQIKIGDVPHQVSSEGAVHKSSTTKKTILKVVAILTSPLTISLGLALAIPAALAFGA